MTSIEGGVAAPWGTKDRNDGAFINCLQAKGVPANQIEFLTDAQADTDSIKQH